MRRVRGAAAVAVMLALLTAGCGGSGDKKDAAGDNGESTAGASTSSTEPGGATGGQATGTTVEGGASAGGQAGGPGGGSGGGGTTTTTQPLPLFVELRVPCVRPGTTQTVTVRSVPNASVAYDTTYSDGKNGLSGGYGGTDKGTIDESGTWTSTFAVGPTAPAGTARVDAVGIEMTGRHAQATAEFKVSNAAGACP